MNKIKITCDSTCDLTKELYEKYSVEVAPLGVILDEDERLDSVNVCAEELFAYVKETGVLPKTSAVSIGQYEDLFRPYVEEGYQVIHINISSELSSCHSSARMAAAEIGNVYVIDSRSLSSGSGLLVLMAAELAQAGLSAEEIVEQVNARKEKLDVSFIIQTLDYLSKGGRCSSVTALGANLLKLHPEIEVCDGSMKLGRKYRGDMEKSILSYIRGRLEGRDDVDHSRIFVTHSAGVPDDLLQKAVALVQELQPMKEILVSDAGCTISSHCGPACLGVLFFKV